MLKIELLPPREKGEEKPAVVNYQRDWDAEEKQFKFGIRGYVDTGDIREIIAQLSLKLGVETKDINDYLEVIDEKILPKPAINTDIPKVTKEELIMIKPKARKVTINTEKKPNARKKTVR